MLCNSVKVVINMIAAVVLVLACVHSAILEEQYVIPESIKVDDILSNERLLKNYENCVLDKGKCVSEGEKLKKTIPEALQNGCAKCNDKVKEDIKKVIHHIIKHQPDVWKELESKYDPKGEYRKKYKDLFEN